jgi:2-polyprenyl-3-methyl-5-hydroxy-6-metoxy-1,4-benzoquinol methylase
MNEEEILKNEVEFFDAFYSPHSQQLAINTKVFNKFYAHPRAAWEPLQRVSMYLGNLDGMRLLDVGCGMGEEAIFFAKLGAHVTAIDISPVGIEIARKRAAYNGVADRVDARCGRTDATGLADQSFDIVHGLGILHHIGLDVGIREAVRLLKPGGKAVFFEHMGSPLIEKLKPLLYGRDTTEHYTEGEKPLRLTDVSSSLREFPTKSLHSYHLVTRLRGKWPRLGNDMLFRFDYNMLRVFPFLRQLAGGAVIYFEVPSRVKT